MEFNYYSADETNTIEEYYDTCSGGKQAVTPFELFRAGDCSRDWSRDWSTHPSLPPSLDSSFLKGPLLDTMTAQKTKSGRGLRCCLTRSTPGVVFQRGTNSNLPTIPANKEKNKNNTKMRLVPYDTAQKVVSYHVPSVLAGVHRCTRYTAQHIRHPE